MDGYEILRRRPLQGETELTTLVDNTGGRETSYTDTSATASGEQYVYGVKAIRGSDRSAMSNPAEIDVPTAPTPTATPVSVSVSCEILTGANHNILQCTASAGDLSHHLRSMDAGFRGAIRSNNRRSSGELGYRR